MQDQLLDAIQPRSDFSLERRRQIIDHFIKNRPERIHEILVGMAPYLRGDTDVPPSFEDEGMAAIVAALVAMKPTMSAKDLDMMSEYDRTNPVATPRKNYKPPAEHIYRKEKVRVTVQLELTVELQDDETLSVLDDEEIIDPVSYTHLTLPTKA